MFALTNKPDMGGRLYAGLIRLATDSKRGTDAMKVIQHMAGVLVETYLVFDDPDLSMHAGFKKLSNLLGCQPAQGALTATALPPAHILDQETERGRQAAREFFEEWLDCSFEFHELIMVILHNIIVSWEDDGQPREESLRLLIECSVRCMAFEISAQELCDIVIEKKVAEEGWSLGDCIGARRISAGGIRVDRVTDHLRGVVLGAVRGDGRVEELIVGSRVAVGNLDRGHLQAGRHAVGAH